MKRKLLLAMSVLVVFRMNAAASGETLTLHGLQKNISAIVYELPEDSFRIPLIKGLLQLRDDRYKGVPVLDAAQLDDASLGRAMAGGFLLYSVFGQSSRLLNRTLLPLDFKYGENNSILAGQSFPSSDMLLVFAAHNPFPGGADGVVYAASRNAVLHARPYLSGDFSCVLYTGQNVATRLSYDASFSMADKSAVPLGASTAFDSGGMLASAKKACARHPEDASLALNYGNLLYAARVYDEACPVLEKSAAGLDGYSKSEALVSLGRCLFAQGKYSRAEQTLNSTGGPAAKYAALFGFGKAFKDWETVEDGPFVFHVQQGGPSLAYAEYMRAMRSAYDGISGFFKGTRAQLPINVFVWKSQDAARLEAGLMLSVSLPQEHVIHAFPGNTPGYHTAQILLDVFAPVRSRTGLLETGVCSYLDYSRQDKMEAARKAAAKNPRISIEALWRDGGVLPSDGGAMAGAFAAWLVEKGGKERFLRLLRNQGYAGALEIYGDELAGLISGFEAQLYPAAN